MKTGVLIINLGTPDAPTTSKVRKYLDEFLNDPRVIDIHPLGRWLLLNLIILPFRPKKSAEAYRKIWTSEGSPLLTHTKNFTNKLRKALPANFVVDFAMRYGNPSIPDKLNALLAQNVDEIILFPQYPHYSAASTGSSLEKVFDHLGKKWNIPPIRTVGPFFNHPLFIDSIIANGKSLLQSFAPGHILFSYHGLPERHIHRSETIPENCFQKDDACCAVISEKNQYCYRAQAFETTRLLAAKLNLQPSQYSTCFQSRLGRTPWIKPYTDLLIEDLGQKGKKKILVFSPSFTADCLETLEEMSLRGKELFQKNGGDDLLLVPSLNDSENWISAAREMILAKPA